MPLSRESLERRAVKAGVKASKKRHHLVSAEELLSLRVQTMPAPLRVALILLGIGSIGLGVAGWPVDSNAIQGLEAIGGIFSILFGAFGIRRTLSRLLESVDSIDLAGSILKLVTEAVSNIDL